MAASVTCAKGTALQVVQLVAKAAGAAVDIKVDAAVKSPTLSSAKLSLSGTNTVAQFVAQSQPDAKALLGATAEEEAQASAVIRQIKLLCRLWLRDTRSLI